MEERCLIGDSKLIKDFILKIEEIEVRDGAWTTKYYDKETGKHWIKYVVDDRSFTAHMLQINPPLSTVNLINIATNSNYEDEAIAAANRLYFEEQYLSKIYRDELLESLQQKVLTNLDIIEKHKIEKVIVAGQLLNSINRKEIIGKSYSEVSADAKYYKEIAGKATELLSQLGRSTN